MIQFQRGCAVAAVVSLSLAGCAGVKQSMGVGKQTPDETSVTTRAPLVVPATFALKPPQPGAPRPQDADAAAAAQRVLGGEPTSTAATQGEVALLRATGANAANPNIRQDLRREMVQSTRRKSYADTVLFWRGADENAGTELNAAREAQRIGTEVATAAPAPAPVQAAPVIEKGEAAAAEPTAQEKKAAEKAESKGWFDWF